MSTTELLASADDLTAVAAARAAATGRKTVSELAECALSRAREVEPCLHSFRVIDELLVRGKAEAVAASERGRLRGVVVGVKDVIDTADLPTAYGSELFAGHRPAVDAAVVAKLVAEGGLVLGKTESTEFAMYRPTCTRNPFDPNRSPGGSSSGSAAAVAAGVVPIALGTQTAGSTIRPAAYCGVYGFKPTRGWTSTAGTWTLAESLDTLGLFARTASDLAFAYRSLRSHHALALPRERPFGRSVGLLRASEWGPAAADVHNGLDQVAERLTAAGWSVHEMPVPPSWRNLPTVQKALMAAEVARNMHAALGDRVELISETAQKVVKEGSAMAAVEYLRVRDEIMKAAEILPRLEASIDLIVAPSALGVAPEGLESTGDPVMCRPWTALGLPAANVPATWRSDGLPVGVQFVSPAFDDIGFLNDLMEVEPIIIGRERS